MADEIKTGDLVVVVRSHCAQTAWSIGIIRAVVDVSGPRLDVECGGCLQTVTLPDGVEIEHQHNGWLPKNYVKKIEPLSEYEHIERKEEVHG